MPKHYQVKPTNPELCTDLSALALVISVALDGISKEPVFLRAGIGVVLAPGKAKH